ncbi:hypothetical protein KY285_026401 [Solanum tuberosum]|nr:hypothetical protein KY285_026401 [Solanum tuberosum]
MDEEVHLTNISINLVEEHNQEEIKASLINSTANQQIELEELNCRTEAEQHGTYSQDHAGPNGKKQDQLLMEKQKINMRSKHGDTQMSPNQNDQHDNAGDTTLDVIEVESSSHFSFGVKPTDTLTSNEGQQRLGKTNNYTNEINYDQMQEQQARTTNSQSKKSGEDDTQAGKASQANSSRDAVSLSSSENHLNANAKGQKNVMLNDQELVRGDTESQQLVDRN